MKKNIFILFLVFLSFSCKPENPWVKKMMKKPLHSDTTAMFKITYSMRNKFEKDSLSYQALFYYSGKHLAGAKEWFVDFPNFKFSYYKFGDSAYLFDKAINTYYLSDLKKDSLLYYFDLLMQMEISGPVIIPTMYQPGFMSTTAKDFLTKETNCIGLSYKRMPVGPLMSLGYEFNMTEMFAKPCTYYAVIDTITRCFHSLYLEMDTSKVIGDNPVSINYLFDKIACTASTHDSIRQMIVKLKQSYTLSTLVDKASFDDYKVKDRNKIKNPAAKENIVDLSQRFSIPMFTLNGDSIRLNVYKGKYILLDFWFINCPPCMRGIAKVNTVFEKYKDKNLMILGINPIDKNIKAINDVVQKREMKYMVCIAPKGFEKYFDVSFYPRYLLISPDQKIIQIINLNEDKDLSIFMEQLDKKLK